MKFIRCKNYEEMSRVAANLLEETIAEKPDAVLGLATGSTPEGMYAELCRDYKDGKVDFSHVTTVNLDEYCNLPVEHEQSYRTFMNVNLFDHVNLRKDHTFLPDGNAADLNAEAVMKNWLPTWAMPICRFWVLAATDTSVSTSRQIPCLWIRM